MKLLWKLNACVLVFCLGMSICAESSNQVQVKSEATDKLEIQSKSQTESSASLERHHKISDMYEENEKMLDKMETSKLPSLKKSNKSIRSIHSFLEKKKTPISSTYDEFEGQSFAETNQKPKRNKKSNVSKAGGISFIHLKNPKLSDGSEWFGSNKCDFKKGFLEILKNENYVGNKVELENSRVLLTPESIKMFTTMDENSLFTTIKLQSILKISQESRYKNTGCFDIVLNEAYISEKMVTKRRVTLCAADKISMGKWVHSIFEMKECNYDLIHKNSKIVLDFNEINKIKKDDVDMKGLYYDNFKKVHTNSLQKSKEHVIKKTVNKLIDTIQVRNLEGAKVARSLNDQLKQAQAFTREMDKKHEMIERIIKKKREQQNNLELKSVKDKAVGKVVLLIKAMAEKIKDMKTGEVKSIKKLKKREIKEERAKAQKTAKQMMTSIIKEKRSIPYNRCTDPKLAFFKDKEYLENVCYEMFGLSRKELCKQPDRFCNMCCRHHLGVRMVMKYEDCYLRCQSLQLKGKEAHPDLFLN